MNSHHDQAGASPAFNAAWGAFLVVASAAGSLVFACVTPFAALAVVAAMTLPSRPALMTAVAVWLANQAVGFGVLAYPVTGNSLGWGLALGLAMLAALAAASAATRRTGDLPLAGRWGAGLAAAFLAQQGALFAASFILGGDGFTATVVGGVASVNVLWTLGLAASYGLFKSLRRAGDPGASRDHASVARSANA